MLLLILFQNGGKYNNLDSAMEQAEKLISEGADIIDVGGESTRPRTYSDNIKKKKFQG